MASVIKFVGVAHTKSGEVIFRIMCDTYEEAERHAAANCPLLGCVTVEKRRYSI